MTNGYSLQLRPGILDAVKLRTGSNTKEQLAAALGVSTQTIDRAKRGNMPKTDLIANTAYILGIQDLNLIASLAPVDR